MSFTYKKLLPTPEEIIAAYPLTEELRAQKLKRDKEIADVISGKSDKFIIIVGPCSADSEEPVCEYIRRLARVNEQVQDKEPISPELSNSDTSSNTDIEAGKKLFSALSYQDKLKYIKAGSADNVELLSWIMGTHKQTAVINACNKRLAALQK